MKTYKDDFGLDYVIPQHLMSKIKLLLDNINEAIPEKYKNKSVNPETIDHLSYDTGFRDALITCLRHVEYCNNNVEDNLNKMAEAEKDNDD
jgi:hypothetical protein